MLSSRLNLYEREFHRPINIVWWVVGADSRQIPSASGNSYGAGSTGGSADSVVVSHTHEQTAHSHGFGGGDKVWTTASGSTEPGNQISGTAKYYAATAKKDYTWRTRTTSETPGITSTGESGAGKNMPPYLAVYVWKRTA